MFQLFPRSRARNSFKSRSSDRDSATDQARIAAVANVIDDTVLAIEAEHAGLRRRVDDVLARAAISMGNESDGYLTRDPEDSAQHDRFDIEMRNEQKRLTELESALSHFKFLKIVLTSRFPDFKPEKNPS